MIFLRQTMTIYILIRISILTYGSVGMFGAFLTRLGISKTSVQFYFFLTYGNMISTWLVSFHTTSIAFILTNMFALSLYTLFTLSLKIIQLLMVWIVLFYSNNDYNHHGTKNYIYHGHDCVLGLVHVHVQVNV